MTGRPKPRNPRFRPRHPAAVGLQLYAPLHEGSGDPQDVGPNRYRGNLVGSPKWGVGLLGPQLSGFTTTSYLDFSPPRQILGVVYPCWMAASYIESTTADGCLACQASTANGNAYFVIRINATGVGIVEWANRDDTGTGGNTILAPGFPTNDGKPHVVQGVSYTPSDHRVYFDGNQAGTATVTIGTVTANILTLGLFRRSTVLNPLAGGLIGFACGSGSVPDPQDLAADFFVSVRPRRLRHVFATARAGLVYAGDDAPAPGYWET